MQSGGGRQQQQQQQHLPGQPGPMEMSGQPVGEGEMPFGDAGATNVTDPGPPPMQEMQRIKGYEDILSPNVAFVAPPPPTYREATQGDGVNRWLSNKKLTEEEARAILVSAAKSKCCWGKGAAEGMTIKSLRQSTAIHYVLKTFLETRSTEWASVPYHGQPIDGPENGQAPAPWQIQVNAPPMFRDAKMQCEVPHTASVRTCHFCKGMTRVTCLRCRGWGRTRCNGCYGTGTQGIGDNKRRCNFCIGTGKQRCFNCHGNGKVPCPTCKATGQVKCYVLLTTLFKTHAKDFILEQTPLPDDLIRNVPGSTIFEDTQPLLNPIQTAPEPQVNIQSAKIIQEHRALAQTGRIWMQNHIIRGVPVFQCDCQWKDEEFRFFVYGDNRQFYTDNYPQTCCCGCQLL